MTRRVLHRLNLPAGTDVTRILNEIGQLRRQVHELTVELDDTRAELAVRRAAAEPVPATRTPARAAPPRSACRRPRRRRPRRGRLVPALAPEELAARIRRDTERNLLRVRNGLKHLAGVGTPTLNRTPTRDGVVVGQGRAVALPQRPSADRHAVAVRPQPGVAQLRLRSRPRQQRGGDDARSRVRRLPHRLGRARRARGRQHPRDLHRRPDPRDRRRHRRADRPTRRQHVRVLLRRRAVAAVGGRQPRHARAQPGRAGRPGRLPPHGADDLDDAGGSGRARRHARPDRQRARRRDAQLVPGAQADR